MNQILETMLLASSVALTATGSPMAQCPTTSSAVTTYHYDNLRTGWDCNEATLTPAIVQKTGHGGFGWLSTTQLDEQVDAQPLFVPNQTITAGPNLVTGAVPGIYDVVYVATENNSIYAIDSKTGKILLHKVPGNGPPAYLGPPVLASNLPGTPPCANASKSVGINGTPVIDLANHAMYGIVYTQQSTLPKPTLSYWLFEEDLGTLNNLAPPLFVSASHLLADGKTTIQFDAGSQRQRPALLFIPGTGGSGKLYAGFGSFCDNTSRGWLLGWQTGPNFAQAVFLGSQLDDLIINPLSALSSMWMSGFGIAADAPPASNLYFVTGNSNPGGTNDPANSVLKVRSDLKKVGSSQTSVLDYFTPQNHLALDNKDMDFGSGGVTLLPDQPGMNPHLAVAAGKDGIMYLNDRDSLTVPLDYVSIGSCFCGQSYFHTTFLDKNNKTWSLGHIMSSGGSNVMVWQVITSASTAYLSQAEALHAFSPGPGDGGFFTSISSSGEANMILWAVPRSGSQVYLYAFAVTQVAAPGWLLIPSGMQAQLTPTPIFTTRSGSTPKSSTKERFQ